MKKRYRFVRKSYAMKRMTVAIARAMQATSAWESEQALRWVAAWGMLCGIKTDSVRLRNSELAPEPESSARLPSGDIEVPSMAAFTLTEEMVAKNGMQPAEALQDTPLPVRQEGDDLAANKFDSAHPD